MKQKNWLFLDFDNTLMATEQYAVPSLIARFNTLYSAQIKEPLTLEIFKAHFHGQARENLCLNLSNYFEIEVDYPTLYDAREWRMMQHLQQLPDGVAMAPNLMEVLTSFSSQNIGLALVSNNPIQRALTAMRFAQNKQGDALAALFGTRFFEAGEVQKPKPDVYLRAMAQVDANVKHSYAVEDSVTGTASAVAAGLTTFGFVGFADNQNETRDKLFKAGCIAVFNDWQIFPECLQKTIELKELAIA